MNITIRRATPTDAQPLASIARKTFFDTFTGTCTEADMDSFLEEYFNLAQVEQELANPLDYFFVAETTEGIVGYMRFMEDYNSLPEMKRWKALELKRLYVSQAFHGKGVAHQLMNFVVQYAVEKGYEVLWLGVWEHNSRAQRFYEKFGFEDSGLRHAFPIGSTPQTDCWYWKFLNPAARAAM